MTKKEKYLVALEHCHEWVNVAEWAVKVGELYPDLLEQANAQAQGQTRDTTGERELAARISSHIAEGSYNGKLEIDASERPRKVRLIKVEEQKEHQQKELEEDVAPLKRNDIIKFAEVKFSSEESYRVEEFTAISSQLKKFFTLNFEVDHAGALLNPETPGDHHPDNMQLLLKEHNRSKSNKNWTRFSYEEQVSYIETAVQLQSLISSRLGVEMHDGILASLMKRLKEVY